MQIPLMLDPQPVAPDTLCLPSWLPVADLGILAGNAFVIRAAQPVLVDTGVADLREPFMAALRQAIDPAELRWIWISHTDADHVGNLTTVLAAAPQARVATNMLGMAKMGLLGLPLDRVHLLAPDQALDLGDRSLIPLRPPYYDAPETTGFFEPNGRLLYCVDSFGALLQAPAALAEEIDATALRAGMVGWSAVDAPWLEMADRTALMQALLHVERLAPDTIISAHLPVARGTMASELARIVGDAYCSRAATAPYHGGMTALAA